MQIEPRITCKSPSFMIEINSMGHWLLIDVVKRKTKIDGMGPFKKAASTILFQRSFLC